MLAIVVLDSPSEDEDVSVGQLLLLVQAKLGIVEESSVRRAEIFDENIATLDNYY